MMDKNYRKRLDEKMLGQVSYVIIGFETFVFGTNRDGRMYLWIIGVE